MAKSLTEQKVLKKLGIEDFRQLTKEKVIEMAGLLDKMDPDVAKKALEQFPEFSKTMRDIFAEYKDILAENMKSNDKSMESFYKTCDNLIDACQGQLDKDDLTFEEKKEIIEIMLAVAQLKGEKDSENKKFIAAIVALCTSAAGITASVLLTVLGGNLNIKLPNFKK